MPIKLPILAALSKIMSLFDAGGCNYDMVSSKLSPAMNDSKSMLLPLVASLAAVTLSVAALLVSASSRGSDSPSAAPRERSSETELIARIDALLEENRELRDRVELLEIRGSSSPGAAATSASALVSREEFAELREELRGQIERRSPSDVHPIDAESEEFKETIASTLSTIRHQERVKGARAYHERRREQIEDRLENIEEWLDLSPLQSDQMRDALLARHDRDAELIDLWEQGVDDAILGDRKRENHDTFYTELSVILDEEQLETYRNREERGGGDKK